MMVQDRSTSTLWRRHARWFIPLLLIPVSYLGFAWLAFVVEPSDSSDYGRALLKLLLFVLAVLGPISAFVFFVIGVVRVSRDGARRRRHRTGRYNAAERDALQQQSIADHAWNAAGELRSRLARQEIPAEIRVWDVVANPGEVFFVDSHADYARFYGRDVSYSQSSGFFFGRPTFVLAGLAATSLSNAARRAAATAEAQTQWRDYQSVRLIVSNQRLICNVGGNWLSFYFSAMTAVYPEVKDWTLVCQFDSTSPIMLNGHSVPAAAIITTLMTHGPVALAEHPSLAALNPG